MRISIFLLLLFFNFSLYAKPTCVVEGYPSYALKLNDISESKIIHVDDSYKTVISLRDKFVELGICFKQTAEPCQILGEGEGSLYNGIVKGWGDDVIGFTPSPMPVHILRDILIDFEDAGICRKE